MPYVTFPLDEIALQEPVPVNVWDPAGKLLLRRGEVIHDEQHRERIHMHLPMVDEAEFRAWTYRYTSTIDRMVRNNQRLDAIAGVTRPMGVDELVADAEASAAEVWVDLHGIWSTVLYQGAQAPDLMGRLNAVEQRMDSVLRQRVDDSLFVLVQMLHDRTLGYNATHALLCALLCRLVAESLEWPSDDRLALQRAALTMNIGIARLHDALSKQAAPLTEAQRRDVDAHPTASAAALAGLGVRDRLWLLGVKEHHRPGREGRAPDLQGPAALVTLLHLADVYVARMGPRTGRPGLPAARAARDIYLGTDGQPHPLGAAFVKTLGAHVPGSYVKLVSGEVAVVVRRGRRANTPMVLSVIGRQGMPLGEPALRDTSEAAHAIKTGVAADEVKVRLPAARVLARL